jgi:integrase
MRRRTKEALEPLQLKRWVRAVEDGEIPTVKHPKTKEIIPLSMPLARSDGDGLTFTLSRSGTASWILRYRYGGRPKELTIGNYPDISLSDARKLARELRAEIDRGSDPASDKRQSKKSAAKDWTVRRLIEDYRAKVLSGLATSTQRSYGRSLTRIESKIGASSISKVTPQDVVALIEDVGATWSESKMLLCAAKLLFRHAAGKKLITANPCAGIDLTALMGKRPPVRRRLMLSEEELRQVLTATMRRENALAIRLLLGTAVRSDELINAKWDQFDFGNNVWTVPNTKTGPSIQIPLAAPVAKWLDELKELSVNSEFVLPARAKSRIARRGGDAPINPNTIGAAIDFWLTEHTPSIRRFTPHDLRSTAKSHMRALGIPRDITEMCLNHKLAGVEGIYDIHTYFEERKEALAKWAEYLVRVENLPAPVLDLTDIGTLVS